MERTVKLDAKDGWGEVQIFEVGRFARRVQGLTASEIGLMLDAAKALLAELQRRVVEMQIEEKIACMRVCARCLRSQPIRDRRTRTLMRWKTQKQTLPHRRAVLGLGKTTPARASLC